MKDFGVRKNASNYYDETCHKAVTAGPQPGEIWKSTRDGECRLILANNGALCCCLKLYDTYQDGEYRVIARAVMYVNPLKPCYAHTHDLAQYVKSLPDAEFKMIHRAVMKAIGGTKE